ncbi:hypothetical protein D9619_001633 [Psilocybe cf. subviscida]|uniref:Hydrophobin n=1 Tax=Psilocybe cf. subviscida TaxID=2480587 RepID=A0A8H5BEV1_9AGAR|nr:hypothetical protein D9619_001633 [Psilocybe cf. subviscida]
MPIRRIQILFLPALVVASAIQSRDTCNTGSYLCCQTVTQLDTSTLPIIGLLGITTPPNYTGLVGLNCTPVDPTTYLTNPCPNQLVCCAQNSWNGIIALDCVPVWI